MSKEKRDYILWISPFKKHILKVLKSEQYWQYYIYIFCHCEEWNDRSNLDLHLASRNLKLNNLTSQFFYSIIFLSSHPEHKLYNLIIILYLRNLGKNNPTLIRKIGTKLWES